MTDITATVIADFRTAYPAFEDDTLYPDTIIEQALCDADAETGGRGWGVYGDDCRNFKRRGMFLYAAHWLAVTYPNGSGSASGGAVFPVSAKTVGDESVNYSTPAIPEGSGDGWFYGSQWGEQFLRLRRRAGMGARAV